MQFTDARAGSSRARSVCFASLMFPCSFIHTAAVSRQRSDPPPSVPLAPLIGSLVNVVIFICVLHVLNSCLFIFLLSMLLITYLIVLFVLFGSLVDFLRVGRLLGRAGQPMLQGIWSSGPGAHRHEHT